MDIAAISQIMNHSQIRQQVGLSITKMAMDNAKSNSNELIKVMEQSINTHTGKNLDIRV